MNNRLAFLIALPLLTGCIGKHVIPADSYSLKPQTVQSNTIFRVAFDQDGFIWPDTNRPDIHPGKIFNRALSLAACDRLHTECPGDFSYYYRNAHTDRVKLLGQRLRDALPQGKELVILIHGFWNNYQAAESNYELLRNAVAQRRGTNAVFLQVYWDGLDSRILPREFPFFWRKAVTYSQFAGMVGLRDVLREIPDGTPIRVITHSRGASVILSAISQPNIPLNISSKWNANYSSFARACWNDKPTPIPNLRVAMIAPAIAAFDFTNCTSKGFGDERIVVGFNRKDRALRKYYLVPSGWFHSTSFGCNEANFNSVQTNFPTVITNVNYSGSTSHKLKDYLADTNSTDRLFELTFGK